MQAGDFHFCGGAILDEVTIQYLFVNSFTYMYSENGFDGFIDFQRHILTAAHCCDNHEARELRIVAGEHDLNSDDGLEQAARVDAIRMHEKYDRDTIENDICILTLREELKFNRYSSFSQIMSKACAM